MSYKKSTYVSLILLIAMALVFMFVSSDLAGIQPNQPSSPATFPRIVATLIIIVGVISFITTLRQEDEKVELANFKYVITTIVATVIFLILWQYLGLFYILSFLLLCFLFYIFSNINNKIRKLLISGGTAITVVGLIYVVFSQLLGVNF
ncbi:tripartite tricarboxylate transporter TctB family protein [Oceanobacillus saliphilus]|uniref:tripartite tricarboxylate transporter TctB family protein n=1 Tax=Oceanobacillus saliphilus TaxID=2925834 RepID=UPI00201D2D4C|nr:tripartite tricarboxylate transporter TctB family protein [Oceanobacillus saliphilus]